MTGESKRATVNIDVAALQHNLNEAKRRVAGAKVMAVIKANGYGHGMDVVAKSLDAADGFAVTDLRDVMRLRELGVGKPITTLSGVMRIEEFQAMDANTAVTIFDPQQLARFLDAELFQPISVWLKLDSGMGRLGFLPNQIAEVASRLRNSANLAQLGLMSHLAHADQPDKSQNLEQLAIFQQVARETRFDAHSLLNSGGIVGHSQQASDWVRPGIMLYGASPILGVPAGELNLHAAMTFSAPLISVRELPEGTSIGYGGETVLKKDTRVGVVACGYGDGYPRHAKPGTPVWVHGQRCTLLGRVSMDMISIDLGGIDAQVDDQVELWGKNNPIDIVADFAGTNSYELMCSVTQRATREVMNG